MYISSPAKINHWAVSGCFPPRMHCTAWRWERHTHWRTHPHFEERARNITGASSAPGKAASGSVLSEMKAHLHSGDRQRAKYLSLLIFCLSVHGKAQQTVHVNRWVKCLWLLLWTGVCTARTPVWKSEAVYGCLPYAHKRSDRSSEPIQIIKKHICP